MTMWRRDDRPISIRLAELESKLFYGVDLRPWWRRWLGRMGR